MKTIFGPLLLWGSLVLVTACNDGKSNSADNDKKDDHATAHQKTSDAGHDLSSMEGMEMDRGNTTDTSLLSVVAAANKVVMSDQLSVPARLIDTTISIKGYGYITWDIRRNKKIAVRTGGRALGRESASTPLPPQPACTAAMQVNASRSRVDWQSVLALLAGSRCRARGCGKARASLPSSARDP